MPLLGVYENADDIDFGELPDQFVLKCNHGSGFNIICKDKNKLDITATRRQLKEWMDIDFSRIRKIVSTECVRNWYCQINVTFSLTIENWPLTSSSTLSLGIVQASLDKLLTLDKLNASIR